MGVAIAHLLAASPRAPYRLVTCSQGRSGKTLERIKEAGIEDLPSLYQVVRQADIIIAVVPPKLALDTAQRVLSELTKPRTGQISSAIPIYLELNSISPQSVSEIQTLFIHQPIDVVDGAIHGLAKNIKSQGMLYLSGPKSAEVQDIFQSEMACYLLGETLGKASALKMLTAGLNKGLSALFFELLLAAQKAGLIDEMMALYQQNYPQIMQVIERITPSYPQHIGRRTDELREMQKTFQQWGGQTNVTTGAVQTMDYLHHQHTATKEADSHNVPIADQLSLLETLLQQAKLLNIEAEINLPGGENGKHGDT